MSILFRVFCCCWQVKNTFNPKNKDTIKTYVIYIKLCQRDQRCAMMYDDDEK